MTRGHNGSTWRRVLLPRGNGDWAVGSSWSVLYDDVIVHILECALWSFGVGGGLGMLLVGNAAHCVFTKVKV